MHHAGKHGSKLTSPILKHINAPSVLSGGRIFTVVRNLFFLSGFAFRTGCGLSRFFCRFLRRFG